MPERFPRTGAFVVLAGALAVIARIGGWKIVNVVEPDPEAAANGKESATRTIRRDAFDTAAPYVELHLVNEDPERAPLGSFIPPDYAFIASLDVPDAGDGFGLEVTDAGEIRNVPLAMLSRATHDQLVPIISARNNDDGASVPSLLVSHRKGYRLSDEQLTQLPGLEADEQRARDAAHYVGTHPDMLALEREIADERARVDAEHAQRRADVEQRVLAQRDAQQPQRSRTAGSAVGRTTSRAR